MKTISQSEEYVVDLDWVAFLLTGDREASAKLGAYDHPNESNAFFSAWLRAWSRRLAIAKALVPMRDELAASALQVRLNLNGRVTPPPQPWCFKPESSTAEIERAVLGIDLFPRCAVVLTILERVPLEDAAILLDSDQDLVRMAQTIGLRDLTRIVGARHDQKATMSNSYVLRREVQHA